MWLDESRVEYSGTYRPGKKVRIRDGEEVLEKHLVPSFQSGRIKVQCWAAISYGSQTRRVRVRKRKPSERKTGRDRLGLNSEQYATEIYESHLISFLFSLDKPISSLRVLDDNAPYHKAQQIGRFLLLMKFESFPFLPALLILTRLRMCGTFSSKDSGSDFLRM